MFTKIKRYLASISGPVATSNNTRVGEFVKVPGDSDEARYTFISTEFFNPPVVGSFDLVHPINITKVYDTHEKRELALLSQVHKVSSVDS